MRRLFSGMALAALLFTSFGAACQEHPAPPQIEQLSSLLERWLENTPDLTIAGDALLAFGQLGRFYAARQYQPVWSGADGLLPKARTLLEAIQGASREGLEPDDYHVTALETRMTGAAATPQRLAELELLLSDAFLQYAAHLKAGRLNPKTADPEWFILPATADSEALLERAANCAGSADLLQELPPPHKGYVGLREALSHYRMLAAKGGWPTVGEGPKLAKGQHDKRVEVLRKRLELTGDVEQERTADASLFDAELEKAVSRFQKRHGLLADGVVGARTVAALNVSAERRVRQLAANMERWRWMPRDLPARYVVVNMAGFELDVIREGRQVLNMRVIVGKPYQRTPAFSSAMTHLVFHPYWNIPPRIAADEIWPRAQKDPDYLSEQDIKVFPRRNTEPQELNVAAYDLARTGEGRFPYKLRQSPGPHNPLGRIKFLLPNPFDVYLHDTPSKELFQRTVRTFSHGCIRLEKPVELAAFLLEGDYRWARENIVAAIEKSRATRTVRLPEPMPIYVVYWTAWVGESGLVEFRDDIYDRDKRMEEALTRQRAKRRPGEQPRPVYRRVAFR